MFVELQGAAGRIEAMLSVPEVPRLAAVVCHPHPLYGGTMHNHATYRLARALEQRGAVTLRFHFRGVGRSAGTHDEGRGEALDTQAMLAHLAAQYPTLPLWSTGFSFGARMALTAARQSDRVSRSLALGLALRHDDHAFVRELGLPVAVVQAERDEFGSPEEVERLLAGNAGPRRLLVVPGATHLFTQDLDALEQAVGEAADWLLAA